MCIKRIIKWWKKRYSRNLPPRKLEEAPCLLYQNLVDEAFGAGHVVIKQPPKDNILIGSLQYPDVYAEFISNFKNRLKRLRHKYEHTSSYPALLEQVKQVADPKNWEGAYAELVAYDIMWNEFLIGGIELDKTLPANDSFAGEMGQKATNEDGYIGEYGLYFDVKIMSDTVGDILKGITEEAIGQSRQQGKCDILCEYPIDDDEEEYALNRTALCKELSGILTTYNTMTSGSKNMASQVMPDLIYRIRWGAGVNSVMSAYSPYRHAENCRHLVFKRYTKKLMKQEPFMLVMVNFPWYNGRINSFCDCDQVFYRSLARRTFCGYLRDNTPMNAIVKKFQGGETVYEVSKHLNGIIFIDDNSIKSDSYTCNIIMNPNAKNPQPTMEHYLLSLVQNGDDRSLMDDLRHDNY